MVDYEYEEPGTAIQPSKPAFKLFKNSKGYNWEIKTVGDTIEECMKLAKKANDDACLEWSGKE